jgi:branched-chain amino acid transport system substrate-binding protein
VSRFGPSVDGSLTTLGVVAAGVIALSVVALQQGGGTTTEAVGPGTAVVGTTQRDTSTGTDTTTTTTGKNAAKAAGGKTAGGVAGPTVAPEVANGTCNASNNGGKTDRGVSATSIKLGATVVQSGIGASFLGPVRVALNAVKNDVNRSGGICGRMLELKLVDDGWDANRGFQFIQNLVQSDNVFALAVNPSSEGVRVASIGGYFGKTRTPVVGSDGMLNDQYLDPWVWPIAASTVSSMHVMAHDACKRLGKKSFSIVFDNKYHFGVEGAFAFNAAVKRCTGKDIPGYFNPRTGGGCSARFCAITAGQTSYDTENKAWNDACFGGTGSDKCDFVALLLEPNEAVNFLRNGTQIEITKGMAQTLFNRDFASRCGSICDDAMVWTGYFPPIEQFAALPAVRTYVSTVRGESPDVDVTNQFLEGGYAGMRLLVDALKRVGPDLTRDRLKATLDSMDLDLGLTTPLRWRPGNHLANASMRAFAIQYKGGFNGFRSVTGWIRDPYLGLDMER